MRDEIYKLAKRAFKLVGAAEQIRRLIKGSVRVSVSAVVGKALKGIASVLVGETLKYDYSVLKSFL